MVRPSGRDLKLGVGEHAVSRSRQRVALAEVLLPVRDPATPRTGGAVGVEKLPVSGHVLESLGRHLPYDGVRIGERLPQRRNARRVLHVRQDPKGLASRYKYLWQSIFGLAAAVALYMTATVPEETQLIVPFFKNVAINLGLFYVVLTYFVIVGTSNAVNLTDGLDGLAIMPTVLIGGALGIFAYATGNVNFAEYLGIPYIAGTGEILVFCAALVGAGLGLAHLVYA